MDSKFVGLVVLFILGFSVFSSYVFLSGNLNVATRASNQNNNPSVQNSLIFAWPLSVPADGITESEISVFIRNQENRGLEGKVVRLESDLTILSAGTQTTDSDGKAVFKVSSSTQGLAEISAIVDNNKIVRTVSVEFK